MKIPEINTVCFVGAGTMGCANSLVAAVSGYQAVLYDVAADNLNQVPQRHQEIAAFLVDSGYCAPEAISEALKRITLCPDLAEATADADLVSESVFERLELKRQVHQKLDELCPPRTILTTNTSALLVSDIEDVVHRSDRFAALHSHLGAPLIDIVGGSRTKSGTIDILKRYVLSLGGTPLILKKEHPGYVLNAMIGPLVTMAMILVIADQASIEEVDRAWMTYRKSPMGPFGMMDLFGLNVVYDGWHQPKPDPNIEKLKPIIIPFLTPYIEKGELGIKTGKGFYTYPDPTYQQSNFLEEKTDISAPYQALIAALIQSAVLVALNNVADPEDIDRAWMTATYLDIGPFGILDQIGIDEFLAILAKQVEIGLLLPDNAAQAGTYLQQYVARGELGEKTGQGFYTYPDSEFEKEGFLIRNS
jgi:enoyl-CoA hydratase/3-hydroxyacyl-CoA dehydrogenase